MLWAGLWGVLCLIVGGYACTAVGDLRQAYRLIINKPKDSQTPFDFLERWHTQLQQADRSFIFILIAFCLVVLAYTWLA